MSKLETIFEKNSIKFTVVLVVVAVGLFMSASLARAWSISYSCTSGSTVNMSIYNDTDLYYVNFFTNDGSGLWVYRGQFSKHQTLTINLASPNSYHGLLRWTCVWQGSADGGGCAQTAGSYTWDFTTPSCALSMTLQVRDKLNGTAWSSASTYNIAYNGELEFVWTSNNANTCYGSDFSTGGALNGTQDAVAEPNAGGGNTYKVTCTGAGGGVVDKSIYVTRTAPAPTVTLTVQNTTTGSAWTGNDLTINYGEQTALRWVSSYATSCTATQGDGFSTGGATSGTDTSITEPGAGSTRYTVSCTGSGGTTTDTLVIYTNPLPTATLQVKNTTTGSAWTGNDITIDPTDAIALQWSSTNSTSCSGSNFSTGGTTSGTASSVTEPVPGSSTTYGVVCSGYGNQASDSLMVTTTGSSGAAISVDKNLLHAGDTTHVSWDVGTSDPANCTIRLGNTSITGYVSLNNATGSFDQTINAESVLTLYCDGGQNSASTTVTVLGGFEEG